MATIGTLAVKLLANTSGFVKGINQGMSALTGFKSRVQSVSKSVASIGGTLSAGFSAPLAAATAAGAGFVNAFEIQRKAVARLGAVFDATGNQAGVTVAEIEKFASARQEVTNFGDEATIQAAAVLASFKQVRGEGFTRTLTVAQDLSELLGTDLQSSVLQLGKALEDPTTGLNSLTRSGISFTTQQKEQIVAMQKAGNVAQAQEMILANVEGQLKGTAIAAASGITQLSNFVGDLAEEVGGVLSPVVADLFKVVRGFVESNRAWIDSLKSSITGFLTSNGKVIAGILAAAAAIGVVLPVLATMGVMVSAAMTAFTALGAIAAAVFSPIGIVVAVAGAAIAIFVDQLGGVTAAFNAIRDAVLPVWNALQSALSAGLTALWQMFKTAWTSIEGIVASAMAMIGVSANTFSGFGTQIVGVLQLIEYGFSQWQSVLALAITSAELSIVRFANQVAHFFTTVIPAVVSWAYNNWSDILTTWFDFTNSLFTNLVKNAIAILQGLWDFVASGGTAGLSVAWTPLTEGFKSSIKELPKIAKREVGGLEAQLQSDVNALGNVVGQGFAEFQAKKRQEMLGGGATAVEQAIQQPAAAVASGPSAPIAVDASIPTDEMKNQADAIKKAIETPAQKFAKDINQINQLQAAGLLTQQEAELARQKTVKDANLGPQPLPTNAGKALEQGTAEAFSAINNRAQPKDQTEENTKLTVDVLREMLDEIRSKNGDSNVVIEDF